MSEQLTTITLSYALAVPAGTLAGQEVSVEKVVRFDGKIVQIVLFFPAGAQGTTGVFFTKNGEQVWPFNQGDTVALDNATIPFPTDISVFRGDKLDFKGNNSDTVSHTIRAVVTITIQEKAYP